MSTSKVSPSERHEGEFSKKYANFVKKNFCLKECSRFVANEAKHSEKNSKEPVCCCGESRQSHVVNFTAHAKIRSNQEEKGTSISQKGSWSSEFDTSRSQTNAFGLLQFNSEQYRKPSEYVRLADDSDMDAVIELLCDYWHLLEPAPNLAITVIGGAKNFELERKKKEIFERGLIKAAQSTNAWIITSGFNMGVMKAVGQAVALGQAYNWDNMDLTQRLRCIGIAPWGYIKRRSSLEHEDGNPSNHLRTVSYYASSVVRHGQPASLNPHHTHFLLVDNGIRDSYQSVAQFRAKLENKISKPKHAEDEKDRGLGIPMVLVLVEGGFDAIDDVYTSLENKIPVVLCAGTGRAADVIAYAYEHMIVENGERKLRIEQQNLLKQKLNQHFSSRWSNLSNTTDFAQQYMEKIEMCCKDEKLITVINMDKDHVELDVAILSALLKTQGKASTRQLQLALTWNRSDVAEDKLFGQENFWPEDLLENMMTTALKEDKVDFVRLFLQNGVNITTYLTPQKLFELYAIAPLSSAFHRLMVRLALPAHSDNFTLQHVATLIGKLVFKYHAGYQQKKKMLDTFDHPFRELLFWAILMNRRAMALFMWEQVKDPVPCALAASWMLGSMADRMAHHDSVLIEQLEKTKNEFEQLAVKVLEECHLINAEKASILVQKKNESWSDMTCLQMAAEAKARSLVCLILPIFIPVLIKFPTVYNKDADDWREVSSKTKILKFYQAPATKFASNLMINFIFLILYSYMILFDFNETISSTEWLVLFWLLTFMIEEVREMLTSNSGRFLYRAYDWWSNTIFNRLEALTFVVACVGFVLRWFPADFIAAKSIYCVNAVFLFIRVLKEYSASNRLGPKLVMILRMLEELMLFLLIFIMIIIAYGVSSQAMMYPSRTFYPLIFRDIFYYPYWSLFGQLFLDDMQGYTCQNGTLTNGMQCPSPSTLVYILTAVYLLVAYILLLNILIAIFNHVFNEIQARSMEIWKFDIYFIVMEYERKPSLVPPFIILEHTFFFVKWLLTKSRRCFHPTRDTKESADIDVVLNALEKESCKHVLNREKLLGKEDLVKKISFIETRVGDVHKMMEEDRMLEEQKLYGSNRGRSSPRRLQVRRSSRELLASTAVDQDSTKENCEKVLEEFVEPKQTDLAVQSLKHKSIEVPMIIVTSEDGKVTLKNLKRQHGSYGKLNFQGVDSSSVWSALVERPDSDQNRLPDAANLSSALVTGRRRRNSWELRIVDDSVYTPHLSDQVLSKVRLPGAEAGKSAEELSSLNLRLAMVDGRISSIESRIINLEEATRKSLHNIESLMISIVQSSFAQPVQSK